MARRSLSVILTAVVTGLMCGLRESTGLAPELLVLDPDAVEWLTPDLLRFGVFDRAEDREKFSSLLDRLGIDQPKWGQITDANDAEKLVADLGGFPVGGTFSPVMPGIRYGAEVVYNWF